LPQKAVIYTADCLKDYYELKKRSVTTGEPFYTAEGLAVDLTDDWGNKYRLLENRNYEAY